MKFIHRFITLCLCAISPAVWSQAPEIYPPNWWTGMKHNTVQLLVKSTDSEFGKRDVSVNYSGISITNIHRLENGKYLAIDIAIQPEAAPGKIVFDFKAGKKSQKVNWELKARDKSRAYGQGVTSADFVYLAMPDRFSNGDVTNDRIKGMRDQSLNRDSIFYRHGGDLQGIINHLDYLQDLGVTTLWMTPVLENDMPDRTEHGYAITNHYKVDARHGGATLYKKLSDELHKRNMKLIQDAVYNHVGLYHFFVQDKPTHDWLHEWPVYTNTTYKDQPLMDTHAAAADQKRMSDGWFTKFMPDLNQQNPYVANFLIQHAIWSVEEFGVDGWRIDTYIYNDLDFMNRCNQALLDEYPNISLFGETWVHGVSNQAFFTRNNFNIPFKSNLPGVTDFQANLYGILPAVNEPFGWTNGVNRLYQTLANDFLYEDPMKNVIFLDNHDMSRFYSAVGEDIAKHKMGLAWLLTSRGIPQLYYGTEILMKGITNPDGWVRLDFPGGWNGDKANKFTKEGRTEKENEVFEWTKKLANFRKSSSAIKTGKMMQYVPEDGVYVYFRYDDKQTVMCIMNTQDKPMTIDSKRFSESIRNYTKGNEVTTGTSYDVKQSLTIPAKYVLVLELQ
ncbi:MAG TPA: glycoside hydrolase family 13 protein [Ohtaekwangia sp.]|uniref:glycoside hydrolase family 13 protein n=1 Tax=Ohtaekwangia sp. TaxID=2066019 RepID=UPI002F936498